MYKELQNINIGNFLNKTKKIAGWIASKRDHGGLIFLDIRDFSGIVQVVCNEQTQIISHDGCKNISKISMESVISVMGRVQKRDEEQTNNQIPTGHFEIIAEEITVLSRCVQLPIEVNNITISDDLKQKHRILYLRSEKMQANLKARFEIIQILRNKMIELGFLEVQTPIITSSSPEGARDFVIPSRLHPGKYYALPQAPQIFKQLLMCSGIEKYFQLAPCFRDEDARADRCYGEFYQLDCEMSFVEQEDVLKVLKEVSFHVIEKFAKVTPNLSRIKYFDSLDMYGTDKPDLRNPLKTEDFSEFFKNNSMDMFKNAVLNGSIIKALRVSLNFGEKMLNNSLCKNILEQIEKKHNFKTAYILNENNEIKGPLAKFFTEKDINNNEVIFFVCDKKAGCYSKIDILRRYLPEVCEFKLDQKKFELVEIVDFPMFEEDSNSSTGWSFTHNPFSKPKEMKEKLDEVEANQYDLVLNGYEICSGSIRNTNVNLIIECFGKTGTNEAEVREKFASIINSFEFGVPPHGGFAIGVERIIMILLNESSVREICAFPLNTHGADPLTNTPNHISDKQKKELKIQ